MFLEEKNIVVPFEVNGQSLISYFEKKIIKSLSEEEIPIRFVITNSNEGKYHCELGVLGGIKDIPDLKLPSIFNFNKRPRENTDKFTTVLLVPTGIGAEIGGHAGDASSVAKLLAFVSDTLITHPNVVNASDINELPENGLYVEGSIISQLLMGTIGLQKVRSNRVLLVVEKSHDKIINDNIVNAVSAARVTIGLNCPYVVEMGTPVEMYAEYSSSGRAVGRINGLERLIDIIIKYRNDYDALALTSTIIIPDNASEEYYRNEGRVINPWGGVEAMLTHSISLLFDMPSAHAPSLWSSEGYRGYYGIVDPRMSAEIVSKCFLHCILKGLHSSPKIIKEMELFQHPDIISCSDISCLVIPDNCIGLPTLAALEQGIPVIVVRENRNCMRNDLKKLPFETGKLFIVENYVEAAGIIALLKAGVTLSSVHRPLSHTTRIEN